MVSCLRKQDSGKQVGKIERQERGKCKKYIFGTKTELVLMTTVISIITKIFSTISNTPHHHNQQDHEPIHVSVYAP